MRVIDCEQGSAEWLQLRVGKITASRICEAMSRYSIKSKVGGETAERRDYKADMVVERMTARSTENFVSPEMIWGRDHEDDARTAYEMETGEMVERIGFILHPTFDYSGASPDGLVGNDGGLEIKCPKTATHIKWMLNSAVVPEEHRDQLLWNMRCAERSWWDFCSFDPRMPDGPNQFIVRMQRDEKRIAEMEEEAIQFDLEIEQVVSFLRKKIKIAPPKPVDRRSDYEQLMAMIDAQEMVP